jgi:hypothetical protein
MKPKPVIISFEQAQEELIDNFLKLSMEERFYAFFKLRSKYISNDATDPSQKRIVRIR